jgi:predicted glycoside hydrolase/deacetylase ChbG (UPF0249 family)
LASASLRRIWLCADDYGLAPGVNAAIRELIGRGRLNATSVMMVTPHLDAAAVEALRALKAASARPAIGLHLTLTAPFAPRTRGTFASLPRTLATAMARRLSVADLHDEVRAQVHAFSDAFGFSPDYLDGHQHVHLFPQVREAVIAVMRETMPGAWLRQCERRMPPLARLGNPKALLLDVLSRSLRRHAAAAGIGVNPAFAGAYRFAPDADFARLFPAFLDGLPEGGLVMCHPGFVDDELRRLDPLTDLREREYAFFAGEAFPKILSQRGFTLS